MTDAADRVKSKLSYKEAGVDISAGEEAVRRIKGLARSTHGPEVLANLGGFGGLYNFPAERYRQPVLVSSTDGVGTKLKVAFLTGRHATVGQDLVNHCVNDILTTGAIPLFFLDYFAAGKLDVGVFESVVQGLAQACRENGCALIGGETAEMPDFYHPGEYDISGTIVGVAENEALLPKRRIKPGQLLVGLYSTGLHTNGYSLARKALLREWTVDTHRPELDQTIGEALLAIHRSYLPITRPILEAPWLRGIGHITGGGLEGNLDRLLSKDHQLAIDWSSWEWPPIFKLIHDAGNVDLDDMRRTFNLGIGWVLVVEPGGLSSLENHLQEHDEPYTVIGEIKSA